MGEGEAVAVVADIIIDEFPCVYHNWRYVLARTSASCRGIYGDNSKSRFRIRMRMRAQAACFVLRGTDDEVAGGERVDYGPTQTAVAGGLCLSRRTFTWAKIVCDDRVSRAVVNGDGEIAAGGDRSAGSRGRAGERWACEMSSGDNKMESVEKHERGAGHSLRLGVGVWLMVGSGCSRCCGCGC